MATSDQRVNESDRWTPAGIGPELAGYDRIADHEADGICDLLGLYQAPEQGLWEDLRILGWNMNNNLDMVVFRNR